MKFNRLYTLLAGAALTVAAAGGYVHYKWQQVETLTNKGPTRLFTVEKGAHAARLIAELGEGETSPWAVRLWLRSHPELVAIKSGTYEIKEGALSRRPFPCSHRARSFTSASPSSKVPVSRIGRSSSPAPHILSG